MACAICGRAQRYHGSEHPSARPGTFLNEAGCQDGVFMDDDEYAEGWDPDAVYPPCPHSPFACGTCKGSGKPAVGVEASECPECEGTGWKNAAPRWPIADEPIADQTNRILARLERARQAGRGARLSADELHILSVSALGELMAQALEPRS